MRFTHDGFILEVPTGRITWFYALVSAPSAQRNAEKMAALRVVVLSGSGRALLNTSKSVKTPVVGRYFSAGSISKGRVLLEQFNSY